MATGLTSEWHDLLSRAGRLFQARRLEEAAELLLPRLEAEGVPYQGYALAGLIAHARGDVTGAVRHLERAVAMQPDDPVQRLNLATVLREGGRFADAKRHFRSIVEMQPGHAPAAAQLADLLNAEGDHAEAVDVCRACLRASRPDAPVVLALADALRHQGALEEAATLLSDAEERWPEEPRVPARLGLLRRAQGRLDEAVQCYEAALARRPGHAPTLNNLGLARLAQGRLDDARDAFARALAIEPGFRDARLNLSAALARLGRRSEALDEARRVAREAPDLARSHSAVAALLSGERDPDALREAETAARRALALDAADPAAWDSLGLVLMKRGEAEAAFDAGRRATGLAPDGMDYWLHLGDNLARAGRLDDAEQALADALASHPEAPEVHRQLGIVLLRQGRPGEALSRLDRCLAKRPRDQRAVAHKALALECLGRMDEAAALLGLDRFIHRFRIENVKPFASVAAFNRQLAVDIRNHPTLRWEPVGLAATGGALTGELLDAPTEAIRVYERELRRAIDELRRSLEVDPDHPFLRRIPAEYRLNTWATLVPEQGEISAHIHEESWLSGAYYAELPPAMDAGRDERAGWLEFGRPSAELPDVPESALRWVEPEEGLLMLFPSYLFHRTLPFRGEGERISLSFDVEPVGNR